MGKSTNAQLNVYIDPTCPLPVFINVAMKQFEKSPPADLNVNVKHATLPVPVDLLKIGPTLDADFLNSIDAITMTFART